MSVLVWHWRGVGDLIITAALCSYLCAYYRVSPYAGHYWSSVMPGFAQVVPCSIFVGLLMHDGRSLTTFNHIKSSSWFRVLGATLVWNVTCALIAEGWRYALIQADPGALWDNLLLAVHLLAVVHTARVKKYWVSVCSIVFVVGVAVNIWNLYVFYTTAFEQDKLNREWRPENWPRRFE